MEFKFHYFKITLYHFTGECTSIKVNLNATNITCYTGHCQTRLPVQKLISKLAHFIIVTIIIQSDLGLCQ